MRLGIAGLMGLAALAYTTIPMSSSGPAGTAARTLAQTLPESPFVQPTVPPNPENWQGRLVVRPDGALYVVHRGVRYAVQALPATEAQLSTLPDGGAVERLDQLFQRSPGGPLPPADPTNPFDPATVGRVGQPVTHNGVRLTVFGTQRATQARFGTHPRPGMVYVLVDVQLENLAWPELHYSTIDFRVADRDGVRYSAASESFDRLLLGGTLRYGERARGVVPFEVPTTAQGLILAYDDTIYQSGTFTTVSLRVALE